MSFEAPPEAGPLEQAQLWYYEDNSGMEQGPMPTEHMRAWFDAGFFGPTTKVAASYYGEVPDCMWPIAELWMSPAQQAFGGPPAPVASCAAASASPAESGGAEATAAAGPMPRGSAKQRPSPYGRPQAAGGGSGGSGGGGGKGDGKGGGKGGGKGDGKGGGKGGKGGYVPPHLMKLNAYAAAGVMQGFTGGGAMGFHENGRPKHNAKAPK